MRTEHIGVKLVGKYPRWWTRTGWMSKRSGIVAFDTVREALEFAISIPDLEDCDHIPTVKHFYRKVKGPSDAKE